MRVTSVTWGAWYRTGGGVDIAVPVGVYVFLGFTVFLGFAWIFFELRVVIFIEFLRFPLISYAWLCSPIGLLLSPLLSTKNTHALIHPSTPINVAAGRGRYVTWRWGRGRGRREVTGVTWH